MQLAKVPLPDLLAEVAHRSAASAPAGLDGDDFFGPPLLLRLAAGKSAWTSDVAERREAVLHVPRRVLAGSVLDRWDPSKVFGYVYSISKLERMFLTLVFSNFCPT